jgi:hypothetical protein
MQCRAHKEALEQLVAKRKEDQEAQRKKIEEEKKKLQEAFGTAVKIIQMLEGTLLFSFFCLALPTCSLLSPFFCIRCTPVLLLVCTLAPS